MVWFRLKFVRDDPLEGLEFNFGSSIVDGYLYVFGVCCLILVVILVVLYLLTLIPETAPWPFGIDTMKDGNEKSEWTSQTFAGAVGAEILILASHLKVDLENPEWEVKIALMGEEVVILGERSDLMSVNPLNAIEVDPAKVAAAVIAGAPTGGGVTFAVQCKRFEKSLRDFQSTESPEARTGIIRRADGIEVSRAEIDEGGDIVLEENKPLHEQKWWTDPMSGGNILWVFLLWLFVMWSLLQSKGLPFTEPRFGGAEMSLCCGLNFAMVLYVFKIYERIANRSLHRYQVEIEALKNEEE